MPHARPSTALVRHGISPHTEPAPLNAGPPIATEPPNKCPNLAWRAKAQPLTADGLLGKTHRLGN